MADQFLSQDEVDALLEDVTGESQHVEEAPKSADGIRSYDLATGRQLWEHEGLTTNAIPTPVTRDGIVYATSGYQGSKPREVLVDKAVLEER